MRQKKNGLGPRRLVFELQRKNGFDGPNFSMSIYNESSDLSIFSALFFDIGATYICGISVITLNYIRMKSLG